MFFSTFPQKPKAASRKARRAQASPEVEHQQRMKRLKKRVGFSPTLDTSTFQAAIYLLTANPEIARRTSGCFTPRGIAFRCAELQDIDTRSYTLLSAARDIYADDSNGVTLADLANAEVVDDWTFDLILNALLIARQEDGL